MARYFYSLTLISVTLFRVSDFAYSYPTPVDFNGKLSRWHISRSNPEVSYEVLSDAVDVEAVAPLVKKAAQAWSNIPTSYLKLKETSAGDAAISVYFDDGLVDAPYASGYAEFDYMDEHDYPSHCTIHVDINQVDLDKTVLHELGHCLGLGHSLIPQSVMSYSDIVKEYKLDTDDVAAMSRLYPTDLKSKTLPPGCATINFDTSSQFANETTIPLHYLALLLLLGAPLFAVLILKYLAFVIQRMQLKP